MADAAVDPLITQEVDRSESPSKKSKHRSRSRDGSKHKHKHRSRSRDSKHSKGSKGSKHGKHKRNSSRTKSPALQDSAAEATAAAAAAATEATVPVAEAPAAAVLNASENQLKPVARPQAPAKAGDLMLDHTTMGTAALKLEHQAVNVILGENNSKENIEALLKATPVYVSFYSQPADVGGELKVQLGDSIIKSVAETLAGTDVTSVVVDFAKTSLTDFKYYLLAIGPDNYAAVERAGYKVSYPRAVITTAKTSRRSVDEALQDVRKTSLFPHMVLTVLLLIFGMAAAVAVPRVVDEASYVTLAVGLATVSFVLAIVMLCLLARNVTRPRVILFTPNQSMLIDKINESQFSVAGVVGS